MNIVDGYIKYSDEMNNLVENAIDSLRKHSLKMLSIKSYHRLYNSFGMVGSWQILGCNKEYITLDIRYGRDLKNIVHIPIEVLTHEDAISLCSWLDGEVANDIRVLTEHKFDVCANVLGNLDQNSVNAIISALSHECDTSERIRRILYNM